MFHPSLWRFVWGRHAAAHQHGLNMEAGKQKKHLEAGITLVLVCDWVSNLIGK